MMTQSQLKELLHYDPDTGIFEWIKPRQGVVRGRPAGCPDDKGYVVITVKGKRLRAHRLAFLYMEGRIPNRYIDHINRVRDDNRWENLRPATPLQNGHNRSGSPGVKKVGGTWYAHITVNYRTIKLGKFKTKEEAVTARKKAEIKVDEILKVS